MASCTTMASTSGKLDVDRYGVPQYSGDSDLFEEYCERAWDLWHGREGQTGLQVASAVHLRAGLSGAAYDAVRKLGHDRLKTKNEKGDPTEDGMKLLLDTLKESIASEVPVRVNELFLKAFYDPSVWRKATETMQQFIVRREQDFHRLEEVLLKSSVPEQVRAMMLLTFAFLDAKEATSSACVLWQ